MTYRAVAGVVVPMPTFPFVRTLNIGEVVELKEMNGDVCAVPEAMTDKSEIGEVVPMPTLPLCLTTRYVPVVVPVEEATTNGS